MDSLLPEDYNLKIDTDIREKIFVFRWTIQNISNIPRPVRCLRFSLSGDAARDCYCTVTNLPDGKFKVSLTYDSENPIPLRIEHSSTAFDSKSMMSLGGTSSDPLIFQKRGEEEVLLDMANRPDGDAVFQCSMKIYGFDVNTTCEVSSSYDAPDMDKVEYQNKLRNMMDDGSLADLWIHVAERVFLVHRFVLKGRALTFFDCHKEDIMKGKLVLSNIDPSTFHSLLLFVYAADEEQMSRDEYRKLYRVAHIYSMASLKRKCAKALSESMSVDSVVDDYFLAEENNDEQLMMQCRVFMRGHLKQLNSFLKGNPKILEDVMKVHE